MQITDTQSRELAREVLEVHQKLRESLARLEKLTRQNPISEENMHNINRILPYFRDRLISHYKIAASHGFFADILELRPDLHSRVDQFIEENALLVDQVKALCSLGEKTDSQRIGASEKFKEAFTVFFNTFNRHQSLKIDMVQEAYNTEFGR